MEMASRKIQTYQNKAENLYTIFYRGTKFHGTSTAEITVLDGTIQGRLHRINDGANAP